MLLDKYVDEHILKPLNLRNTGLLPPDIAVHMRVANGTITATPYSVLAAKPGDFLAPGGNSLTSTLDNYRRIRKQITRSTLVLSFPASHPD
jgi:CubicO group peptidase (beta-lactamase class C family)